jgi:hypothetical protein
MIEFVPDISEELKPFCFDESVLVLVFYLVLDLELIDFCNDSLIYMSHLLDFHSQLFQILSVSLLCPFNLLRCIVS